MFERVTPEQVGAAPSDPAPESAESLEYEIVLSKRQLAIWLFLGTMVIGAASAGAYFVGRATPQTVVVQSNSASSPVATSAANTPASPPVSQSPAPEPAAQPAVIRGQQVLVYQEPVPGATYVQLGALDKGMARVMAEGLRALGYEAIVAPGPNERVFRVLIGPAKDAANLKRLKDGMDELGLSSFVRSYDAPK
jgi:cell division septation protein DedD